MERSIIEVIKIISILLFICPMIVHATTLKEYEDQVAKYTAELKEKKDNIAKNTEEVNKIKRKVK